ncbi:traB domain-containing protein isoform X2 [Lingula anatina]|uniref:TraB domain-containing protein isoform X2 n=1 Tax=Lingula anatina TaxID=7574 RepID=A0A1S3IDW5_LINAN|nr:traB domain-containing protein isoform X2 [Lingula anatina]|eukprot:XP_013396427.1 traB domain-containing protein isoform X2 [Lingula anatina]
MVKFYMDLTSNYNVNAKNHLASVKFRSYGGHCSFVHYVIRTCVHRRHSMEGSNGSDAHQQEKGEEDGADIEQINTERAPVQETGYGYPLGNTGDDAPPGNTGDDGGGEDSLEDSGSENDSSGGEESDVEDNFDDMMYPSQRLHRHPVDELPRTVAKLETKDGCMVYVVGTAHFSEESQEDVAKTIHAVQPDIVVLELCRSRVNILELDESTLLQEAQNINLQKIRVAIKQNGLLQGVLHLLLLSMSAHLTKELGMAPGGEFRRAFQEAQTIPGCRVHLGDRPIGITLKRALGALSWWQKLRLGFYMLTTKDPISKEDVEKCKQKDLLEEMLKEMTGDYPALSTVFVQERDIFLANSLKIAAQPLPHPELDGDVVPSVVVGVVGIGHLPGIKEHWEEEHNVQDIMTVPPATLVGTAFRWIIRAGLVGLLSWGTYRLLRWSGVTWSLY